MTSDRRRFTRRSICGAAALCALLGQRGAAQTAPPASTVEGASAPAAASAEERGAMTVSYLEGSAISVPRGAGPQTLSVGSKLHEGDVVQTAAGTRLEIELGTGTLIRLGENTRMELQQAPASGAAFRARLALGNLWAKVHKLLGSESFAVETDNAVAGVRGTEFRVESGGAKGEDLVRVYEGAVQVDDPRGKAWSHRVEPAHEVRCAGGRPKSLPVAFDPASERNHPFLRWVRERGVAAREKFVAGAEKLKGGDHNASDHKSASGHKTDSAKPSRDAHERRRERRERRQHFFHW